MAVRYEYKLTDTVREGRGLDVLMNQHAQEGWRVHTWTGAVVLFEREERPVEHDATPDEPY